MKRRNFLTAAFGWLSVFAGTAQARSTPESALDTKSFQDGGALRCASSAAAKQNTVPAATRTLSERFGDIVNLKDFGAKGDGKTDDTAAWKAWTTALDSSGTGYIPAGTYLVNGASKAFPHGCIGKYGDTFSSTKPGVTDRFSYCIPVGQEHVIKNSRSLTISTGAQGNRIYPAISFDAKIDVPANASPVTVNGKPDGRLISSCHGILLQHILTGGNSNNRLSTAAILTHGINDAKGDNDCVGSVAIVTKTDSAGVGDSCGSLGRVDNYSKQRGGVMGMETVAHNYVQGIPRPSDFHFVSTGRWITPLHVVSSPSSTSSPVTAGILIQGSGNGCYDGIQNGSE